MKKEKTPGRILYKCRLCGGYTSSLSTPDISISLFEALGFLKTRSFGGFPIGHTDIHYCSDGNMGIADLAGARPEGKEY